MSKRLDSFMSTFGAGLTDKQACSVVSSLRRLLAVAALILFAVTWKLWTPQNEFPRIPLIRAAGAIPGFVEWALVAGMLIALSVGLIARESSRWWRPALLIFAACLTVLILCDQQRLQTWAYQFAIMAPVMALVPARRAVGLLQIFTASIYLHSALSKFSMTFLKGTGPQLLAGLLHALRLPESTSSSAFDTGMEVLLPLGELLVALLLLVRPTRRFGLYASIAMHLVLLLTLGPLGLNNKPGVLVWSIYFILQNVVLFWPRPLQSKESDETTAKSTASDAPSKTVAPRSFGETAATAAIVAAIVLPFLEPLGLFDHWPSWAVYAGSAERIKVYVPLAAREKLPESLRPWLFRPTFQNGMSRVAIDRWAISVYAAPIYPEDRFQLGVALWIARRAEAEDAVVVAIESRASRWDDQRTTRSLRGVAEIERELETFRWNGFPREPADRAPVSAERSEPQ